VGTDNSWLRSKRKTSVRFRAAPTQCATGIGGFYNTVRAGGAARDYNPGMTEPADASAGDRTTVRELLEVEAFRLSLVAGDGAELRSPVRWAHTTELLDPGPYLRGGELVCTVGAFLTDEDACRHFVASAAGAGAVGLCFGLGDVHESVPPALASACAESKLPLLLAPFGVPFISIAEYLSERRVIAEGRASRRAESLLAELLAGVRAQSSVSEMLAMAAASLDGQLQLTVDGRPVGSTGTTGTTAGPDTSEVTAELSSTTVLTWSGTGSPPSQALLLHLGRVIELAWHERDVEAALTRERVGQLLLLVGDRLANPVALRPMLDGAGIEAAELVVSAWPAGAAPLLAVHLEGSLVGEAPGIALAVSHAADPASAAARALALPCGHSRMVELADLASAIAEARAALELSRSRGVVVGPESLTSLEGLLEQQPPERLDPFIDQLLAPLISADELQGTKQLETLRAFLDLDGSLQRTAEQQYLHVNTVRHRLARIHRLTGHDPLVFADRAALAIAVWALDRRQKNRNQLRAP
jgi:purine catabolism regulator